VSVTIKILDQARDFRAIYYVSLLW